MPDKKRVIALGFFDGIHVGHSALLNKVNDVSERTGLIPSVITFDTHPMSLVTGAAVPMINSTEDRAGLISRMFNIDDIIFLHFDKETERMPWSDFVRHLYNEFGARHLVAGHDFTFGAKGEGNSDLLLKKCDEMGIGCDIIDEIKYNGSVCSSTVIRKLIANGEMSKATEYLGHPHVLTDIVRVGFRLGRTIGTPTINMRFQDGVLIPAHGVYATRVYIAGEHGYTGVTNVGVRPTVSGEGSVTAETHILNFRGNLYGKLVRIEFYTRLRSEKKFDGIEQLKSQILIDCENVLQYFAGAIGEV